MNRKGISMISLVVIIIVTLILVGIATTAGYRYITQVNKVRAQALQTAIGDAAYRRQNDVTSGVSDRYYDGYMFNIKNADFTLIEYLPEEDFSGDNGLPDGIPDYLQIPGSMWYLFDAESATNIGADKAEGFLTRNLSYYSGPDVTDEEKNELLKLVLADYATGEAYYVRMPAWVALDAIGDAIADCPNSPTGKHKFTVATCTEPSVCIYCGLLNHEALGHLWIPPTCTEAGRCQRCGIIDPDHPALGHLMISNDDLDNAELIAMLAQNDSYMIANVDDPTKAWVADANKHWHQCIRCGIKQNEDPHDRHFVSLDERTHQELCSICGWESVVSLHKIKYESVTDDTHKVWCEACLFGNEISGAGVVIHDDSGWLPDNPVFHYRICEHLSTNYCNNLDIDLESTHETVEVIFKEAHYDNNGDYLCDVCGRNIDTTPPPDFGFEDFNSYVRVVDTTTSTITLEAYTDDQETHVAYYNFGILNETTGAIEWTPNIPVSNPTDAAQYTFTGLESDKEYTFYVRATDSIGNQNNPYEIKARTSGFPDFENIRGVPEGFVKGPYNIGVVPVETTLPDISLVYKQNTGDWSDKTPIENMDSIEIPLSLEREVLYFKFVDEQGNESRVWTYTVECIDATPPSVTITPKAGDNNTSSALYHQATVTISDIRSGIDKDTPVRYGWSTSNTTPPSEANLKTINTPNLEVAGTVSFDVVTPEGLNGDFYLWVMRGVEDFVGNATTDDVVSTMKFTIDDEQALLTNIKMLDLTPSPEVPEEKLFVKTDGEVTVTFTSDKLLRVDPIVRINGVDMTSITHSGRNYTCKIRIDNTFEEGTLQLFIADVMSINGRVSDITYTNDDIVNGEGPVYYDKTLPVLENIKKKTTISPIDNGGEVGFQASDGG